MLSGSIVNSSGLVSLILNFVWAALDGNSHSIGREWSCEGLPGAP